MSIKDITIIITSFKSEKKIRNCLNSIDDQCSVINVENSNNEKHKANIEKDFKNVKCILSGENLGYGKLKNKLDKKTRKVIELGTTGRYFWIRHEVRGKDTVSRQWFPAEEKNGSYVLSAAGKKKMNEAINQKKSDAVKGSSGASC